MYTELGHTGGLVVYMYTELGHTGGLVVYVYRVRTYWWSGSICIQS